MNEVIDLELARQARRELDALRGEFPHAFVGRFTDEVIDVVRQKQEQEKMVMTGLKITPEMRDRIDAWRESYRARTGVKLARTDAMRLLMSMALEREEERR